MTFSQLVKFSIILWSILPSLLRSQIHLQKCSCNNHGKCYPVPQDTLYQAVEWVFSSHAFLLVSQVYKEIALSSEKANTNACICFFSLLFLGLEDSCIFNRALRSPSKITNGLIRDCGKPFQNKTRKKDNCQRTVWGGKEFT